MKIAIKKISCTVALFSMFWLSFIERIHAQEGKPSSGLSQDSGESILWETSPRAIFSGNGGRLNLRASEGMILLYVAPGAQGQDVMFTTSHTIGDKFSKSIQINTEAGEASAHGENDPHLELGRGIYVSWEGDRDIKFSRSMNFGRSFEPPIRINDDTEKTSHSFFDMKVAPDGSIWLAWLDGRDKKTNAPGTYSIYVARSTDQGASFGKNIKVAGDVCPCCRTSIAFGKYGQVYVSWRRVLPGDNRIVVVASSKDGGASWTDPVAVTPNGWKVNGCPHSGPAMSYIDGKLFVVWYTGEGKKARLNLSISEDNGKTFLEPREIQGEVLDANHPQLVSLDDESWIIFQGRNPKANNGWENSKAWVVKVGKNGVPGKPEMLPSRGGSVVYPNLTWGTGGRVYGLWTEISDKGNEVVLCRGRINGN